MYYDMENTCKDFLFCSTIPFLNLNYEIVKYKTNCDQLLRTHPDKKCF